MNTVNYVSLHRMKPGKNEQVYHDFTDSNSHQAKRRDLVHNGNKLDQYQLYSNEMPSVQRKKEKKKRLLYCCQRLRFTLGLRRGIQFVSVTDGEVNYQQLYILKKSTSNDGKITVFLGNLFTVFLRAYFYSQGKQKANNNNNKTHKILTKFSFP